MSTSSVSGVAENLVASVEDTISQMIPVRHFRDQVEEEEEITPSPRRHLRQSPRRPHRVTRIVQIQGPDCLQKFISGPCAGNFAVTSIIGTFLFVLCLDFTFIIAGSTLINKCPAKEYLPAFMITFGIFNFFFNTTFLINFGIRFVKIFNLLQYGQTDSSLSIIKEDGVEILRKVRRFTYWIAIILGLTLVILFIVLCVIVYPDYDSLTSVEQEYQLKTYCHPVLSGLAFWFLNGSFIVVGGILIIVYGFGCFSLIAIMAAKKPTPARNTQSAIRGEGEDV